MERVIFHIDVNNAYLSWEALYRLNELGETMDLRTIPSAIGGDKESRHGIILAKSMPARRAGVKTAETLGDARKKCPNLVIVPPHMAIYKEYSKKLMALLQEYSPVIEQYSIDEAFVDMTGLGKKIQNQPVAVAEEIRRHIYEKLGFTVNIGVSSNKILAKMASGFEKPNKVHSLFPDEIQKKMWPLPVGNLFLWDALQRTAYLIWASVPSASSLFLIAMSSAPTSAGMALLSMTMPMGSILPLSQRRLPITRVTVIPLRFPTTSQTPPKQKNIFSPSVNL